MEQITVDDLAALGSAAVVIDVREQHEYDEAHVEGVRLIPMSSFLERIDEVPMDERIYIMCAAGGRSAQVAMHLNQRGYDAVNVAGGIQAWHGAGHPVLLGSGG